MAACASWRRRSLLRFTLQLALLVAVAAITVDNAFTNADLDGNGMIDKDEYQKLILKVHDTVGIPEASAPLLQEQAKSAFWASMGLGYWNGFASGFGMILATEVGDKTFFIAAIMAMQYSRTVVFAGSMAALGVMTVLSALLGFALPNLIPREYTHYAGALLFLYFGLKMLKEGYEAEGSGPSEELAEVEHELIKKRDDAEDSDEEKRGKSGDRNSNGIKEDGLLPSKSNAAVFSQSFTLIFLAEWGDRSQIATIALAAVKNAVGVTVGGFLGHCVCTGFAVLGGRLLAARISEKTVHLAGGTLFILSGLHSLIVGA